MAKLYFYYSSMNAGKTTALLQSSYNYNERGMETLLLKPRIDTRDGDEFTITSRIGLSAPARAISNSSVPLTEIVQAAMKQRPLHCVLVDEAQFLTEAQVEELCNVVDDLDIPVLCYGLRTDFQGKLFPGSAALLASAEKLVEVKGICECGSKATHVLRLDCTGKPVFSGDQIAIGGNDTYSSVCRKCHTKARRQETW